MKRRKSTPHTFDENIASEKAKLAAEADKLPYGHPHKDRLLKRIRQLETALHMSEWLTSPGLRAPG